ncbi:MAG: ferrous iron transport protein B [Bacteroidales bacterium]|nr:ferrous iron transport protein B [Bacteroidales bacterium]
MEEKKRYICNGLCEQCPHTRGSAYCNPGPRGGRFAHRIDRVLTNRWIGLPILVLLLFLIFEATFALGAYPQAWIDAGVDKMALRLGECLPDGWFSSLLADGVLRGCGAVVSFLPNIVILFCFLSVLEDSGYMARAAYLMDTLMHAVGLHGSSFIPMIVGFGCNVPAIMAARDIENRKDRTLTMLMIPFMSCSARLPVYLLLVSAFFPDHKAPVMIGLYVAGILLSVLFAFVMKHTRWFRKGKEDSVFELPAFRVPAWRPWAGHVWARTKDYLQKITTVILAASVIIWALEYFPLDENGGRAAQDRSCLAEIGRGMEPVMAPLGFTWKMNVCILTGLPAKEAIVSTMGILYPAEASRPLPETLRVSGDFTPASALAFMIFVLLYFPCIATVRTLHKEIGWKWSLFSVLHSLGIAWLMAFGVFSLLG